MLINGYAQNVLMITLKQKDVKMGIIEDKVRAVFKEYDEHQDIFEFAIDIAHIGDYSVRSMTHWNILINSINQIKEERSKVT